MRVADLENLRSPFMAGDDPELAFPLAIGVMFLKLKLFTEKFSMTSMKQTLGSAGGHLIQGKADAS